jgi:hypothetical protein
MQIKSVMPKGSIAVPYRIIFCCGFGCGGGKV